MGRLIDNIRLRTEADLLLKKKLISPQTMAMIHNLIDEQPTAFDVQAVCEQFVLKGRPLNPDEHYITIPEAIEIAKGGVKNEKTDHR